MGEVYRDRHRSNADTFVVVANEVGGVWIVYTFGTALNLSADGALTPTSLAERSLLNRPSSCACQSAPDSP